MLLLIVAGFMLYAGYTRMHWTAPAFVALCLVPVSIFQHHAVYKWQSEMGAIRYPDIAEFVFYVAANNIVSAALFAAFYMLGRCLTRARRHSKRENSP